MILVYYNISNHTKGTVNVLNKRDFATPLYH